MDDSRNLIKGKWDVQKSIKKKQVAGFPVNSGCQSFAYCRMRQ